MFLSRRASLLAALLAAGSLAGAPRTTAAQEAGAGGEVTPIYFGNGCFWGRQKEYVDVEKLMGRQGGDISAVVGYAGGQQAGPDGAVCYYYAPKDSVYERLGHAEVVQLELRGGEEEVRQQMRMMADKYFSQFVRTPRGMQRLDPQDAGPGYRNVIGIPGGVDSPLFSVLQDANVHGMQLLPGSGNVFVGGRPSEDDQLNVVYVVDSNNLPFYRAEQYHQFHNGIGAAFPLEYTVKQKAAATKAGRIGPTGCPDFFFF